MSTPSTPKFLAFRAGLTAAFNPSAISTNGGNGVLEQTTLQSITNNNSSISPLSGDAQQKNNMTHLAAALEKALMKKQLQGSAAVTQTTRGVVVQILADKVFYASDSAALGTVGAEIVDTIAGVIRSYPNNIEVDGYTDNQAIYGGPFTSNWELSSVRAANVVNRLNTVDHLSAGQLASVGYGANDPVASKATPEGRLENRRIDVVILEK
jgi:chemotaxis protein MotB